MCTTNSFSHLTLEERRIILTGITNGSTKTAIAQTIGKEKSTIGKEIKKHRVLAYKCKMPLECNNYRKCTFGRQCTTDRKKTTAASKQSDPAVIFIFLISLLHNPGKILRQRCTAD